MPRPTPFVHRNLPLLLLRAREALMQHYRPGLRAHGLSDQQWRVLRVLREHEGGLETGRLAQQAYILGPSLTGMLARMEKSGLVARQRCPDDARRSASGASMAQGRAPRPPAALTASAMALSWAPAMGACSRGQRVARREFRVCPVMRRL